jgi:hypothetical protein
MSSGEKEKEKEKFPLPHLTTLTADAYFHWINHTRKYVGEHSSHLQSVVKSMYMPEYVIHRVPTSESSKNTSAYGINSCPYNMKNDKLVTWESAHNHAFEEIKIKHPEWTDAQCQQSLGSYSDKTSWELSQFNQYFRQVTEIIPKIKNRFDQSILAVVDSNGVMNRAETSLDLISWLTELKNICSSSAGHAVASLEEARNKMRGLKMIGENYEEYASKFLESVDIIKSSPEFKNVDDKEFIETFLIGLNNEYILGRYPAMVDQYLIGNKSLKLHTCKELTEVMTYVKDYIQDVTKPRRRLTAINNDHHSKQFKEESGEYNSDRRNQYKADNVIQTTSQVGYDQSDKFRFPSTGKQFRTEAKSDQMKGNKYNPKQNPQYNQKPTPTWNNKNTVKNNLTKATVDNLSNRGILKNKRKADEMSDISITDNNSVCLVFLATGKCNRNGCNLSHLDEYKKKAYLEKWSSNNPAGK